MSEENPKRTKQRSTIEFPYSDLDGAVEMVSALHKNAGHDCTTDQLASFIGMTPTSGTFRLRLATARTFGLLETIRGGYVNLTELGQKIVDTSTQSQTKVEAFYTVPLYRAIYEKFKGKLLPGRAGIEREMVALGVAQKQKERARQAFERSARQAGFYDAGEDRLVEPINRSKKVKDIKEPDAAEADNAPAKTQDYNEELHPFIKGLLQSLPDPNSEWDSTERLKWLQTASGIFGLMYKGDGAQISVNLTSKDKNSQKIESNEISESS
ncbi:MAG: hypothetical protein OER96_04085 [Gammaproteobacteria bacterium]|nr:hypothetical protein [Gammaproteobacteria bacterium]